MKQVDHLKKLLCPPGNGVYTVHTAQDNKNSLHQTLYGTSEQEQVIKNWSMQLENLSKHELLLLGVCSDAGGGIHRGANWGPLLIREHLYQSKKPAELLDIGDIRVIPHLLHDKYLNKETIESCREALYNNKHDALPVSPLSITEAVCNTIFSESPTKKILSLGGDHSVSYPLVKTYLETAQKNHRKAGLLHFDAHTDLLDKRLGIDLCFGSWTYHVLHLLESPTQVAQVGIRSTGHDKKYWKNKIGIEQYWSEEVKKEGADAVAKKVIKQFEDQGVQDIYISVDIDALDIQYAPATGTPETEGLAPHEVILIIREVAKHFNISGADLVELAPFINPSGKDWGQVAGFITLQSATMILNSLIEVMEKDL